MPLQEGIYHAQGKRPGGFLALLLLRIEAALAAPQIAGAVQQLWDMYQGLKRGAVRDLPAVTVPGAALSVLIGYGYNAFQRADSRQAAPAAFKQYGLFRAPATSGGGPLLIGSGLRYAPDVTRNPATEHIVIQLIADTELAVNRGVVETWKLLDDLTDAATGLSPLQLSAFYTGFQREDHRSWIDFHDGISNLRSDDRLDALAIKPTVAAAEQWTAGGTYLTFLRISVNLATWRRLSREQQERLVGRDKLSGCPLTEIRDGAHLAPKGCPFTGTHDITDDKNAGFREPPVVDDPILAASHVQRANHRVLPISDPGSLRIFRQGYEFLEPTDAAPGFRAGLNFVAFQDTPQRLARLLTQPGWLGSVNFGGDPAHQPPGLDQLLLIRAGATYLVPPVTPGEVFPGAGVFVDQSSRVTRPAREPTTPGTER